MVTPFVGHCTPPPECTYRANHFFLVFFLLLLLLQLLFVMLFRVAHSVCVFVHYRIMNLIAMLIRDETGFILSSGSVYCLFGGLFVNRFVPLCTYERTSYV